MMQGGGFDCLLLDLKMPVLSGLEVYLALRDQGRLVPTILITAHASGPEAKELCPLTQGLLVKPFDPGLLLEKMAALRAEAHTLLDDALKGDRRAPEACLLAATLVREDGPHANDRLDGRSRVVALLPSRLQQRHGDLPVAFEGMAGHELVAFFKDVQGKDRPREEDDVGEREKRHELKLAGFHPPGFAHGPGHARWRIVSGVVRVRNVAHSPRL